MSWRNWPTFVSYGLAALAFAAAFSGNWGGVVVSVGCVSVQVSLALFQRMHLERAISAARLRSNYLDCAAQDITQQARQLAPTAQEAAENLAMMFGHELPPCEPIEACPSCSSVASHLLGEPETGDGRRLTTRTCRSCGHTWRERLDV